LFVLRSPVANLLDTRVAFFNDVIRCVLQLQIRRMPPLVLAPILYHQWNQ
jgi:hypothetical protein